MSRISETLNCVLETYDWQDVAEDLQERIDKLKEYINNLYENEYISYGTKEEMLKIIEGEDNEK